MAFSLKRPRKRRVSDCDLEDFSDLENEKLTVEADEEEQQEEDDDDGNEQEEEEDGDADYDEEEGTESGDEQDDNCGDPEIEELEKELKDIQHQEQEIWKNLRRHKDEDIRKGQAVRNQKALWDKTLEFRFFLQKAFSSSNRLPMEPVRSVFCDSDGGVSAAYSDLITTSTKTLESMLELQEALIERNPSIAQSKDGDSGKSSEKPSENTKEVDVEGDEEWSRITQMHRRIAPFRDESIYKWQRNTQVMTGAAAIKGKLQAFNQNISKQVADYMRDPSRMIKQMQQKRSMVSIFGAVPEEGDAKEEEVKTDGDPELLDDSEFYQQLLKEFFESIDPTSSETAFYALKKLQPKKRKIVDRRSSKNRKIRYNIHEKIVNFMAPQPMDLPPMAPKLFENLFGLKTQKFAT